MLGKRIYELRKKLNISQEEFATAINTSRQSVSKWELGVSYPEVNKLKDIARFFNVSIDYLLDYDLVNTSCEEFITKLNIAFQNKDFSITVNEIKSYILRFNNNIYLYMYSAKYLLALELDKNQQNLLDLIISYCKKVISLYDSQERNDIVLKDIHIFVIQTYLIYKKHDLAMEYMIENKVYHEAFLAECYYRLKKYNDVSNTFSNLYVSVLEEIFSTTHLQIRVLLKQKNVDEAYELTNWIVNLIDSIIKKKDAFTQIQIVYLYLKLVCEKMLKITEQRVAGIAILKKCLPSTSPANAAWSLDKLTDAWKDIKDTAQ